MIMLRQSSTSVFRRSSQRLNCFTNPISFHYPLNPTPYKGLDNKTTLLSNTLSTHLSVYSSFSGLGSGLTRKLEHSSKPLAELRLAGHSGIRFMHQKAFSDIDKFFEDKLRRDIDEQMMARINSLQQDLKRQELKIDDLVSKIAKLSDFARSIPNNDKIDKLAQDNDKIDKLVAEIEAMKVAMNNSNEDTASRNSMGLLMRETLDICLVVLSLTVCVGILAFGVGFIIHIMSMIV